MQTTYLCHLLKQSVFVLSVLAAVFEVVVASPPIAPDTPDVKQSTENGSPLPATVRVVSDHAYLRAGPGEDFYPTERLVHGQTVEIWAVDPAGACAVRPVEGSFSWVRACDIDDGAMLNEPAVSESGIGELTDGVRALPKGRRSGVIVSDGAISRIGSQLNDLRHVAQVRLEAGERVQVIEEVRIMAGRHQGLWVRIEPPAGEFRWARLADLEIPPGLVTPVAAQPTAEATTAVRAGEAMAAIQTAGEAIAQAVALANAPGNGSLQGENVPLSQPALTQPAPAPQPLASVATAKRLFAGWLPLGSGVFDSRTRVAPVAVSDAAIGGSGDELADIDLTLSLAVAGPSESWNLAPLRERLRLSQARPTTQSERLRAEAIDARLSRFESVQNRQQALASNTPADDSPLRLGGMWSSLSGIGTRPIRPGVFPGGVPADGKTTWTPPDQVETTGRLATVVSRRPDAPRWALVDGNNQVLVFVTPIPNLNLAPLVGQQVSVRGARGYMPEYKRPYLVASEARMRLAVAPVTPSDPTR